MIAPTVEPSFDPGTRVVLSRPTNPSHRFAGRPGVVDAASPPSVVATPQGEVVRVLHWVSFEGGTYRYPCYGTELAAETRRPA